MPEPPRCWFCGCEFEPAINMANRTTAQHGLRMRTREHLVPTSRGGADDGPNVVDACWICNVGKGARTVEEYRHYLFRKTPEGLALAHLTVVLATKALQYAETQSLFQIIDRLEQRAPLPKFYGERG
jgi:hypothetical protein